MEKPVLTAFCFTDIHNQQAMLDYPTVLRKSYLTAAENAVKEFGKADLALIGGDNVSDYPEWDKSCALPKKNFLDLKYKLNAVAENTTKSEKFYTLRETTILFLAISVRLKTNRTILPIFTIVWKNRSVNFPKTKNQR